jgi:glycosyltransferase involved in cell wall biosynthesis
LFGRLIDLLLYKPYRQIACISAGTKDALFNWMPKLIDRLAVVENGAELAFSKCVVRPVREKAVVVSLGRLHPLKNYDVALRAIAELDDLGFEYWIAGVGDDLPRLSALAKELGVEQKVRFLGFIEDVPQLLRKADLALIPSTWEGFGLVAVEAMNAGLPVVASDVDGLREVVSSDCALTVPPDRSDLFATALRQLIENAELRQTMGAAGFERSQHFSAKAMVENYIEFYRDVLNG